MAKHYVKLAVITGSASGIGAATRALFEQAGVSVIGIDIEDAEITADLSTKAGRESAIAGVKQLCGHAIDSFVACAGLATYVRPLSLIPSVDYFGAIDLLDGLFGLLQRGTDPAAVVILSNSAQWLGIDETPYIQALLAHNEDEAMRIVDDIDDPDLASGMAYVGSKLVLGRAIRQRASAWGEAGVRLNGVAPGNTRTPMLEGVLQDPFTRDGVESMKIPLGRLAEPEEVAKLISFLCSSDASYIHGSIYYIDGGIDAYILPSSF